jgi:hypothetical protein
MGLPSQRHRCDNDTLRRNTADKASSYGWCGSSKIWIDLKIRQQEVVLLGQLIPGIGKNQTVKGQR